MTKKRALITGITGQDGSYLAEYLLGLGYEVHGIVRRVALEDQKHRLWRLQDVIGKIKFHYGSLESYPSIFKIFQEVRPHECYHLAAQSFVSYSFEDEFSTFNSNINGTHFVLSSIKNACPECRFYFAASSEMFGKVEEVPQKETTRFHPRSVYGISKVAGYDLTRNYRGAYNIFAVSGILFNHESPRRGFEFVTRKITSAAARIKLGLQDKLQLGNLEASRDWGHSKEYVKAMHLMLKQNKPEDFVIGTGKTHTVREFADKAFGLLGLDYKKHIEVDKHLFRPSEVELLVADPSRAKKKLGWKYTMTFDQLVEDMVKHDYDYFSNKKGAT
ncbi:MAG: GDP-mannose 4,6-dehydratase [Candidatus Omnitrophica bacterium]|nr:GDP-mannose 4,6-dehydratase [Candidatus Omnitrophota bacterium]